MMHYVGNLLQGEKDGIKKSLLVKYLLKKIIK
jgi:hypothetical protein